jgi:uncharacterized protein (DUF427 family)
MMIPRPSGKQIVEPGPGQESVWSYPRPPRLEATTRRLQVLFRGTTLADTRRGFRVLETSHPPTYYLPPADVRMDLLTRTDKASFCEWKGMAHYYAIGEGEHHLASSAWGYDDPTPPFAAIAGHVAFYAAPFECFVDGERVTPQPGGFYAGWITRDLVGPFKGTPGTSGW